jgi:hypothetical protein
MPHPAEGRPDLRLLALGRDVEVGEVVDVAGGVRISARNARTSSRWRALMIGRSAS